MQNKEKGTQECAKKITVIREFMSKGKGFELGRDWP